MQVNGLPLIAILRGIRPEEVVAVATSLVAAGIRYIEIPMNSPDPYISIEKLIAGVGDEAVCGAGTVMSTDQVDRLASMGAKLIVSPHTDQALIEAAVTRDLMVFPGVATATEAIMATQAGATHLKLFPAGDLGESYLGSLIEVLPVSTRVFAVGHVATDNMASFWRAGASGFGIGSGIYRPGATPEQVMHNAQTYVTQLESLMENNNG